MVPQRPCESCDIHASHLQGPLIRQRKTLSWIHITLCMKPQAKRLSHRIPTTPNPCLEVHDPELLGICYITNNVGNVLWNRSYRAHGIDNSEWTSNVYQNGRRHPSSKEQYHSPLASWWRNRGVWWWFQWWGFAPLGLYGSSHTLQQ